MNELSSETGYVENNKSVNIEECEVCTESASAAIDGEDVDNRPNVADNTLADDKTGIPATINLQRYAFTTLSFEEKYKTTTKSQHHKTWLKNVRINKNVLLNLIWQLFPILKWLPQYKLKDYILGDILGGLTVGIFCVPQSMAFSLNANLPPVYGLYVAFFPVIVYILMGTSHHLSVGTFAIISIMAANAVEKILVDVDFDALSIDTGGSQSPDDLRQMEWLKVHTTLCLLVGIIQVVMGIFRLGFITMYLSRPILRGFTTGASFHILASQFKYLFGLEVTAKQGPFAMIYMYIDILSRLRDCNPAAVVISVISLLVLVVAKELMQKYKKKSIPIELFVVSGSILGSYFLKWNDKYGLPIIGDVPTGIPKPTVPPIEHFPSLLKDAFVIALVSYVMNISQAMIIASKNNYRIDSSQEFIAYGCGNAFASFFSCFTSCGALARTLIFDNVGAKSQIASLVQIIIVLVVLLSLGPLFEPLPKCVLACIVITALTGMFRQLADIKVHWKTRNWCDLSIWLVTWLSVSLLGVAVGLLVGVGFSFLSVVVRTQRPQCVMLGEVVDTEIYKEVGLYDKCYPLPGFKIFQMKASLYFANAEYFKDTLVQMTEINPDELSMQKQDDTNNKVTKRKSHKSHDPEAVDLGLGFLRTRTHTLVIDCGYFSFLDSVGVGTLADVINMYSRIGITVVLADCKETILNILERQGFFRNRSKCCCFPSIHDAVLIRKKQHAQDKLDNFRQLCNTEIHEDTGNDSTAEEDGRAANEQQLHDSN